MMARQEKAVITSGIRSVCSIERKYCMTVPVTSRTAMIAITFFFIVSGLSLNRILLPDHRHQPASGRGIDPILYNDQDTG
jgi:hypothetical protein